MTFNCTEKVIIYSRASGGTYGFHGAEGHVGDELGAGGGDGETDGLVLDGVFGAGSGAEDILEHLVETELAAALGSVSNEGGEPSLKSALDKNSTNAPRTGLQGRVWRQAVGPLHLRG